MSKKKIAEQPLQIQYKSVDELIPYARNPRQHSDEQISQIAASIKRFGWSNPILLDGNNNILAGHGRLMAAKAVGLSEVPCIDLSHLTEDEKRAYIITDNQTALTSTWDIDLLKVELQALKEVDFDLSILGFAPDELADLLLDEPEEGLTDPDEAPAVPNNPVSVNGDIWLLGNHRVMCGDSTVVTDVESLMAGSKADMIFTDPPYGVNFEQGKFVGRDEQDKSHNFEPIANDELKGEDLTSFIASAMICAFTVSKQAAFYVWAPPLLEGAAIHKGIKEAGWKVQSQITWKKIPWVVGRADYHWQHENCWYGFKQTGGHAWYGGRDKGTVWEVAKLQKSDLHPTMKPVELGEIAISNSSKGGDIILDLFAGSGSTLIAAEKLGRHAYCMELSPQYVDVIIQRYINFTGKQAIHESTGKTFAEMQEERL